jgi:hypothetical protein
MAAPNVRALDLEASETYFALIPIHRLPGGAFVRASAFLLGTWDFSSDEMGRQSPRGAEEG